MFEKKKDKNVDFIGVQLFIVLLIFTVCCFIESVVCVVSWSSGLVA